MDVVQCTGLVPGTPRLGLFLYIFLWYLIQVEERADFNIASAPPPEDCCGISPI